MCLVSITHFIIKKINQIQILIYIVEDRDPGGYAWVLPAISFRQVILLICV